MTFGNTANRRSNIPVGHAHPIWLIPGSVLVPVVALDSLWTLGWRVEDEREDDRESRDYLGPMAMRWEKVRR